MEAVLCASKMFYAFFQDIVSYQQKFYIMQLLSSTIWHFLSALKKGASVLLILILANKSAKAALTKL